MNYMDYCIDSEFSVRNAMRKLDNIKPKILFIVQDKKVAAALTDGDIRRFLLNEGRLDDMAEKPKDGWFTGHRNSSFAERVRK
ncbi:MAG: hypothetical protein HFH04_06835, partial [Dorea sp.]|nr:hypothetical protein [Dorea sp.]